MAYFYDFIITSSWIPVGWLESLAWTIDPFSRLVHKASMPSERKTSFCWNWYLANSDPWHLFGNVILAPPAYFLLSPHPCGLPERRNQRQLVWGIARVWELQLCLPVALAAALRGLLISSQGIVQLLWQCLRSHLTGGQKHKIYTPCPWSQISH